MPGPRLDTKKRRARARPQGPMLEAVGLRDDRAFRPGERDPAAARIEETKRFIREQVAAQRKGPSVEGNSPRAAGKQASRGNEGDIA